MKSVYYAIEVSRDEHYKTPYLMGLKEDWPSLAKDFRHYCHLHNPSLGETWVWTAPNGQKYVHFIIDDDQKKMTNEERMHSFKMCLRSLLKSEDLKSAEKVVLPKGGFKFNDQDLDKIKTLITDVYASNGVRIDVEAGL